MIMILVTMITLFDPHLIVLPSFALKALDIWQWARVLPKWTVRLNHVWV